MIKNPKEWSSPPSPQQEDLRFSPSSLHPTHYASLLASTKSSIIPSLQGGCAGEDKHAAEHIISTISSTKARSDCNSIWANSFVHQEGGHWLEEDKIYPLKKRRVLLNLDSAPGITATQGEMKNVESARTSRKRTIRTWADHVSSIESEDDDFKGVQHLIISSPAAEEIVRGDQNIMKNDVISTNARCTRTSGKGWRCSEPSFGGYSMCEYHFTLIKNSRKNKNKKKKNSNVLKLAASKDKITPKSSCSKLLQRGQMDTGNARRSRNSKNKILADNVLNKNDDSEEGLEDAMNCSIPSAENIKVEEKLLNNSTTTRCTRSKGKGWRCSKPNVGGSTICEHHETARRKEREKQQKQQLQHSIPREVAESKVKAAPNSPTTLLNMENMNIGNTRRSSNSTNKIRDDDVLNKDDELIEDEDVMMHL